MISGARYQRVATYSVNSPSFFAWSSTVLASPKSQIYSPTIAKTFDPSRSLTFRSHDRLRRRLLGFKSRCKLNRDGWKPSFISLHDLHVGTVNVFHSSKKLIGEVENVIISENLRSILMRDQLREIRVHQTFDQINVFQLVERSRFENFENIDDLQAIGAWRKQRKERWMTFSCFNRWRMRISLKVRWQVVIERNGEIFLMATFLNAWLSKAELEEDDHESADREKRLTRPCHRFLRRDTSDWWIEDPQRILGPE